MNYLYASIAALLFGGGIYVGRLTVEVLEEKAVVKVDTATIKQDQTQESTDQKAEAQHDQDIEHPAPLIIKQPVWLQPPPSIVVQFPASPANPSPAAGPADPGPAIDLRPQLAAFAKKYEDSLSDCRRMAAEWPTNKPLAKSN